MLVADRAPGGAGLLAQPTTILIPMGNTFQAARTSVGRQSRVFATSVALLVTSVPALGLTTTQFGPWAWACVLVAGFAGWAFGTLPIGGSRTRALLQSAIAFGIIVAFGGVLVYVLLAELGSLLPDSDVARPESPFGYVLLLVLSVAGLGPFATPPMAALGLVWAAIVRTASQRREHAPVSL